MKPRPNEPSRPLGIFWARLGNSTVIDKVLDARGKIADGLAIHDAIAKKRGGRRIPCIPTCAAYFKPCCV